MNSYTQEQIEQSIQRLMDGVNRFGNSPAGQLHDTQALKRDITVIVESFIHMRQDRDAWLATSKALQEGYNKLDQQFRVSDCASTSSRTRPESVGEMNTPENPPAFPRAGTVIEKKFGNFVTEEASAQLGISTRDFFAAAALMGMAAGQFWNENIDDRKPDHLEKVAECAYKTADAMLAERQKQKESR